jgi:hypothetical protein
LTGGSCCVDWVAAFKQRPHSGADYLVLLQSWCLVANSSVAPSHALGYGLPVAASTNVPQFFGEDWSNIPAAAPADFESRLAELSDPEKMTLLSALARLDELEETIDAMDDLTDRTAAEVLQWQAEQAEERRRRAAEGGEGGAHSSAGSGKEPYPGANPRFAAALEVFQGGETILVDPQQEEAARRARQRAELEAAEAAAEAAWRARAARAAGSDEEGGAGGSGTRQWGQWGPRTRGSGQGQKQEESSTLDSRIERWAGGRGGGRRVATETSNAACPVRLNLTVVSSSCLLDLRARSPTLWCGQPLRTPASAAPVLSLKQRRSPCACHLRGRRGLGPSPLSALPGPKRVS